MDVPLIKSWLEKGYSEMHSGTQLFSLWQLRFLLQLGPTIS